MNKNILKASLIVVVTLAALGGCGSEAIAAPNLTNVASRSAQKTVNQDAKMNLLKTRADNEINRRVTTLNNLTAVLNNTKKLTDADKTSLTTQVNAELNGLTALKTKIDADSDITILRADVSSIVKDYRVYVLLVPKVRVIAAADKISSTSDIVNNAIPTIQSAIDAAKAKGIDTSALQTKLTEMQSLVIDAKAKISSINTTVMNITPDQYNANHAVLTASINNVKTAWHDLQTSRDDFKFIEALLKGTPSTSTATSSASY